MIRWPVPSAPPMPGRRAYAVVVATLAMVGGAAAQPARGGDAADVAFFRGRALMEQGDRAGACAAFRESEALRPAAGTELNLAACLEADGHLVDAAAMLEQARARAQGRAEASRFAKAVRDLAGLRARIPVIVVARPPGRRAVVRVDSVAIADIDAPIALDPGAHRVEVVWDDGPARDEVVTLREGQRLTLTPPPSAASARDDDAPVVASAPRPAPVASARRSRLPLVVGGAGALLLGAGAVAFVTARGLDADARAACPAPQACPDVTTRDRADDLNRRAVRDARIAVGLWVGAGVAVSAATYLWLRGRPDRAAPTVAIGAGGAAVGYAGSF